MGEFRIIALDGPGGVGKSTVGRALAGRLGYFFLSSGQIYRALAYHVLQRGWEMDRPPEPSLMEGVRVTVGADGALRVNGEMVGEALGSEEISAATSRLSTAPEVRHLSTQVQRDTVAGIASAGRYGGVILEGRDIGTVVFPAARHKFFLTASVEARARRRFAELASGDPALTLEAVLQSLQERDERDQSRELAPLKPAEDALIVDTSERTLQQVVDALTEAIGPDGPGG